MYGHIANDGIVGELFEAMPPEDQYHELYWKQIIELPEGVSAGWRFDGDAWIDPREAGRDNAEVLARAERNRLLDRCDIIHCNAANWDLMDEEEKAAWHVYKQKLRDVTEQAGFPYDVAWPKKPKGDEQT